MLGIPNIGSVCYSSFEFVLPQIAIPSYLVQGDKWKALSGSLVEGMIGDNDNHDYVLQDSTTIRIKLTTLNDPETHDNHVFIYKTRGACTVKLISDGTTIDTWVENDNVDTTHTRILTTEQAGLVNYSDLYIEVTT